LYFLLNIEDETSRPNRKVLEDDADVVRRPERYARKWRKLAQVSNKINKTKSKYEFI
jgi:hypothetical protein